MGMPNIVVRCQMFRGDWDQVWSQMRMLFLMEGVTRVNQTHLQQFEEFKKRGLVERGYPVLYRSGLHYETEKGTEIWPDIPSLVAGTMGKGVYPGYWGDCEDFAMYRTAELRELPWHYERVAPWNRAKTECADPRFPQPASSSSGPPSGTDAVPGDWSGWKRVDGGIKAMPFAKWRRGPKGNYHYHALVLLPDGRLEDPSLVLGMGREKAFSDAKTAEKMKAGAPVVVQYAKEPEVMVVDPEKPSGYSGGIALKLDEAALAKLRSRGRESVSLGDVQDLVENRDVEEVAAYLSNGVELGDTEFDVDQVVGWSRAERAFRPRSEAGELRRLMGYSEH